MEPSTETDRDLSAAMAPESELLEKEELIEEELIEEEMLVEEISIDGMCGVY